MKRLSPFLKASRVFLLFCSMISILKKNNWLLLKIIILTTILVPLGITAYEIIVLQKESVLFLGNFHPALATIVLVYYGILLLAGAIWIILQLKSVLKLKNERIKNELLHLQSQVNPHFFFNMLNNLYGLVDVDSEKAKALILKLSELMRYSIYEGERKTVTLKEEVDYLQNYIDLHRMRYHKAIDIEFNVDFDKNMNYNIMPLLYIILVENAFKHGVENLRQKAFVHISLNATYKHISFVVKNNYDKDELPKKPGIGIKNLKRRLELAYPNQHNLTFTSVNDIHTAHLDLNL
ncbi:sensor histidine kinase [Winogradskyella jejuensis]|uniref:Histidine kinase n=1 Tax=Winogradskyella jejuensis TaxID=1089305 RepID=A0A1M5U2P5_9FLAO|nr:histidine kinase [Winogradskyella jejuensis]SHH57385.1 Histidine kinase [Winogradskyella jejuensis]